MGAVQARCLYCRKRIAPGGRTNRKFCKPGCRTLAYRARRRETPLSVDAEADSPPTAPKVTHSQTPLQPPSGSQHADQPAEDQPSEAAAIVLELKRQHEQASDTFGHLLALVHAAHQRELSLEHELHRTQEALHASVADQERLRTELVSLRDQLAKRRQAETNEEDVHRRLQVVEHSIEALTLEWQQRRKAEQPETDGRRQPNEALQRELEVSASRVSELAAAVQRLQDELAAVNERLASSQQDLSSAQRRVAEQEAELEQARREHANSSDPTQKALAESMAQRAALEAEVARLHQEREAQEAAARRQLSESSARLSESMAQRTALEAEVARLHQEREAQEATARRQLSDSTARLDELALSKAAESRTYRAQITRLTTERDGALNKHQVLLSTVRDLVPLPPVPSDQLWARVAPVRTRLKHPFVHFLEPFFARSAQIGAIGDNLLRFGVLFAQSRISAMMTLGPDAFSPATSDAILEHVLTSIMQDSDFYPDEARVLAEEKKKHLRVFERVISIEVVKQLSHALSAATVT